MAICSACGKDMRVPSSCVEHVFIVEEEPEEYRSVPYGSEDEDWGAKSGRNCGDCNCPPGGFHHAGCDVERCPRCGGQAIGCDCEPDDDEDDDEDDEL
jgi:hypothetical protein